MTIPIAPSEQQHPAPRDMVIRPPRLRDELPWPRGMVIAPPPTGDRMPNLCLPDELLGSWFAPVLETLRSLAELL